MHFKIQSQLLRSNIYLIFLKMISVKNSKLEEQISLGSFLISFNFDQLYLVNLCPIFVGLFPILSDSSEKNKYIQFPKMNPIPFLFYEAKLPFSEEHGTM